MYLDIDECSLHIDNCSSNASCANIAGSFVCSCNSGYTGSGTVCEGNGLKSLSLSFSILFNSVHLGFA